MKKFTTNDFAGIELYEEHWNYDNLATILVSYFEDHCLCPKDGELDDNDCWKQWAVDRANKMLQLIADKANRINDGN